MNIPLVDLKRQYDNIKEEVLASVEEVFEKSAFISGPFVSRFEEHFSTYLGVEGCVGVGNGTDAIVLALQALGVGAGDEVIIPASTFIATGEAVTKAGAKVVIVDIDSATCCISPESIQKAITSRTKGIIVVHLYGYPTDIAPIQELADKHNLWILEDCAQAHGAVRDGTKVGAIGNIATFSFYPGKNLGAYGDAGAVVSNSPRLLEHVRMNANHGRTGKYQHSFEGHNSRMDGVQGAILSVKLQYLDEWTKARRMIADRYRTGLNKLVRDAHLILPPDHLGHVYHLFVVQTRLRDELLSFLKNKGVHAGVHYPHPLHLLKAYSYLGYKAGCFPHAERLANECLSLPICPNLSLEKADYIIENIEKFFE